MDTVLFIHPVLRTPLKRGILDGCGLWLEGDCFWLMMELAPKERYIHRQ
ncbi:MAG: hypothetical protein IPK11_07875 [Ignavibacteria bacterium]|nr:hypothetical protein [Ignavibacteria bacterium]